MWNGPVDYTHPRNERNKLHTLGYRLQIYARTVTSYAIRLGELFLGSRYSPVAIIQLVLVCVIAFSCRVLDKQPRF